MDPTDLDRMSELSPFELKDTLIKLASSHSERLMLNAGRGEPNFLTTVPRHAFFQLGLFAISEAERSVAYMPEGVGGLPKREGIAARFEIFAQARHEVRGIAFLTAALCYARDQLGFSDSDVLHELTRGVLGCNYPSPVRAGSAFLRRDGHGPFSRPVSSDHRWTFDGRCRRLICRCPFLDPRI
jgi:aspartate 4-decarboxylase